MLKKAFLGGLTLVVILAIGFFVYFFGYPKYQQVNSYRTAEKQFASQQYEEAKKGYDGLGAYKNSADKSKECSYLLGVKMYEEKQYDHALACFSEAKGFQDSNDYAMKCKYAQAELCFQQKKYKDAAEMFLSLGTYSDSANYLVKCKYEDAVSQYNNKDYDSALAAFDEVQDYADSKDYKLKIAEVFTNNKNYDKAKAVYSKLGTYKDSQDKLKQLFLLEKYANYDENYYTKVKKEDDWNGNNELITKGTPLDINEFEKTFSDLYYAKWINNGTNIILSELYRNDKKYGIKCVTDHGMRGFRVYYYYLDNPDKIYCDVFDVDQFGSDFAYSLDNDENNVVYTNKSEQELQKLEENYENEIKEIEKQANFSKEQVYNTAKQVSMEKVRTMEEGAYWIYHKLECDDINNIGYSYNPDNKQHSLNFGIGSISIFGTTDMSFHATVILQENDDGSLTLITNEVN